MGRRWLSSLSHALLPAGVLALAACGREDTTAPIPPHSYYTQVLAGVVVDPTGKPLRDVAVRLTGIFNGSLGTPTLDIGGCHGWAWLPTVSVTTDDAGKFSYAVGMISSEMCVTVEAIPPAGLGLRAGLVWLPRFAVTSSTFQPDTTWIGVQLARY